MSPRKTRYDNTLVEHWGERWPFQLERSYLIAPPLALFVNEKDKNTGNCKTVEDHKNPVHAYDRLRISDKSVIVIREGDMVPTLWNPIHGNCVYGQHSAKYLYHINREKQVIPIDLKPAQTSGKKINSTEQLLALDEPHTPQNYFEAVTNWLHSEFAPE